jgi:hypothetical protein
MTTRHLDGITIEGATHPQLKARGRWRAVG